MPGKQVVMVGDPYQLPPVVDDDELARYFAEHYGGPYFFQAQVWKNAQFRTYELTEIWRQKKDQSFRELLNAVREGSITDEQLEQLNERCVVAPESGVITGQTHLNNDVLMQIEHEIFFLSVRPVIAQIISICASTGWYFLPTKCGEHGTEPHDHA